MKARGDWTVAGVVGLSALLRSIGLGSLALTGDESYWWLWSRRLDWSYYDHPAGMAFLVRASTTLGGGGEGGVRWLNALLGVGCVWLIYGLGRRLLSRRAGLLAASVVAWGAPYLLVSRFVYTDTLHLFLMLLNLHLFWRLLQQPSPSPRSVLAFGLTLALLFNTKYSAYVYAGALFLAVLWDHRPLLSKRGFWLGCLIGGLGMLPALAWNATHDWVSYRWQFSHATRGVMGDFSLLGNVRHSLLYLTWPLALLALAGLGRLRDPAERLLSLLASVLLLPVISSPANSPRNLVTGLVFLLLLAGTRLPTRLVEPDSGFIGRWRPRLRLGLFGTGLLLTGVYGLGTVIDLTGPSPWPSSSVVQPILKDAAGWREFGPRLADEKGGVFTLDYSLAAQVHYYADRPAYTSHEQYRIWGIPEMQTAVVVGLEYLSADFVSSQLEQAFERVQEPERLVYAERGAVKEVYLWRVEGPRLDQETFLDRFDFLTLLETDR